MTLCDVSCRNARPGPALQKLSDSGGLQLWVHPNGGRYWRLAYRYGGKQKVLALGVYPMVSLADARRARDEAREQLAVGLDPAEEKKKIARNADHFRVVAAEYVDKLTLEGLTEATISKTKWLLEFANPTIGDLPMRKISAPAVLEVVRKVEARGRYETAHRLRSTVGSVFRYAIATGRADTDPTVALRGALIRHRAKPRAAILEPEPFGGLLRAIDGYEGQPTTRVALQLMALTFPRSCELRAAEWKEFDFEKALWIIPGARMKMRRAHRVPLAIQTIDLLRSLQQITGEGRYVFPNVRTSARPITDNALIAALRRLGYGKDEISPHGFRATAATLLNESGRWHPDAIERQLAHEENNDVRRAYTRGEHWSERVVMMQWWADYLDEVRLLTKQSAEGHNRRSAIWSGSVAWLPVRGAFR